MLLNTAGQVVAIDRKFNSHVNPEIFKGLREVLETSKPHDASFQLGARARLIDNRKGN